MENLVWIGALISLLGVAGLVWCIIYVIRLRSAALPESEMRAKMQRAVVMNFAALAVSTMGLMVVVMGIFLT